MGTMTRTELITEGLTIAGRTGDTSRALTGLRTWLHSQYRAWDGPFLRKAREGLALPAGTQNLPFGAGEGGITNLVKRVMNPIWVYDSAYGTRAKTLIVSLDAGDPNSNETINDPAAATGLPRQWKLRQIASTVSPYYQTWKLQPTPVPDRAYLLAFDYIEIPIDPCPSGSTIPLYPNDQTMIQCVVAKALLFANGVGDPDFIAASAVLAEMVKNDRLHDGFQTGTNYSVDLDSGTFK